MIKILEKSIADMFGSEMDEYGEKYINVYKHEWKEFIGEVEYFKALDMYKSQFEGCIIYALSGILTDEKLEKFKDSDEFYLFTCDLYCYK